MRKYFTTFLHDETGVVSTDWIMLTAGVVMLGLNAVTAVKISSVELGGRVGTHVIATNGK